MPDSTIRPGPTGGFPEAACDRLASFMPEIGGRRGGELFAGQLGAGGEDGGFDGGVRVGLEWGEQLVQFGPAPLTEIEFGQAVSMRRPLDGM